MLCRRKARIEVVFFYNLQANCVGHLLEVAFFMWEDMDDAEEAQET
jgi:hypothetical protein